MFTTDFTKRSHPIKALVGIRTLIVSLALVYEYERPRRFCRYPAC